MFTITHTHEAGTLIEGTAKGDGSAVVLKANRWRWSHNLGAWYVPQSRDRSPQMWLIERTAEALRAAGFDVATEIDTTTRSTAEVEVGKIARQAARVEALTARAARTDATADALHDRVHEMCDAIPMGQPVMGARDRAYRDKIGRAMDRAYLTGLEAQETERKARAASHTNSARYNAVTVANRIAKFEAEIRKVERSIAYGRVAGTGLAYLEGKLAELTDQVTYWQGVRAEQIETGKATGFSKTTVSKGDRVRVRGQWRRVVRVNAKTVSVETGYSWTDTVPYAEIQQRTDAATAAAMVTS